jgi:hypothetical protein
MLAISGMAVSLGWLRLYQTPSPLGVTTEEPGISGKSMRDVDFIDVTHAFSGSVRDELPIMPVRLPAILP